MSKKRTEFEQLLVIDAWSCRIRSRTLRDPQLKVWNDGIKNGDLYALRLFRQHKKEGRL
jgi:hypothetical protein